MLKIGYFADGPWSHKALDLLLADPQLEVIFICARYSNPDLYLKERAGEIGIDYHETKNVNDEDFSKKIKAHQCDIFISMSFDQILKKKLYSQPRLGTINCHAGKLPMYRGRNVLNWVLINDEKEFGITVHYIDDGVDTGDILLQQTYPIDDQDDYGTLLKKAHHECATVLYEAIKLIKTGKSKRVTQKSIKTCGMICSQRKPGDEMIDWNWTSREVFNFVRALTYPGPMAQTKIDEETVFIKKVEIISNAPIYKCIPGAILAKENVGMLVKTGDSYIRIVEWSSETKLYVGGRLGQ